MNDSKGGDINSGISEIRYGRPDEKEAFLSFIDDAFGFPNEKSKSFYSLLPKLYGDGADPCKCNLLAFNGAGEIVGAVGVYRRELEVCGETLTLAGVGNVACRSDKRGSGIMSELMRRAIADATASGADLSDLGGKRHRYGHFGYEGAGCVYCFDIGDSAIRHGGETLMPDTMTARTIEPGDTDALDEIMRLHNGSPSHMLRPRRQLYDILSSWCAMPVGFYRGGILEGYAVVNGDDVTELTLKSVRESSPDKNDDIGAAARALIRYNDGAVRLKLPPYEVETMGGISRLYDGVCIEKNEQISVFRFARVIRALLRLRASSEPLPYGELKLLIHGIAGDESIYIKVSASGVSVENTDAKPDIELGHRDAIAVLFGMYAPQRALISYPARAWLPLPLYITSADNV